MTNTADPVGTGLVASLAHPGGNVTGLTTLSAELSAKRLELLREVVPKAGRIAVLWDAANPAVSGAVRATESAGRSLGVQIFISSAGRADEIESVFSGMVRERVQGVVAMPGPIFLVERRHLSEIALKYRLPVVFPQREYVESGGLMAYGSSLSDLFARAAQFVDRIVKGARSADLPVEQPTKFELIINLKTAKALGLTIPQSLLLRADQVIEQRVLDHRGVTLFDALQAFFQEHQYCGELDGGVEGDRVWMTCACGAVIVRALEPPA